MKELESQGASSPSSSVVRVFVYRDGGVGGNTFERQGKSPYLESLLSRHLWTTCIDRATQQMTW